MPIAHCYTSLDISGKEEALIENWQRYSGKESDEMTINVMSVQTQAGKSYAMMVQLFLPDLWTQQAIQELQEGLVKAFMQTLSLNQSDVHIITHLVSSGRVCEDGRTLEW